MNQQQILMLALIAFILYLAATGRLRAIAGVIAGNKTVNNGNLENRGTETNPAAGGQGSGGGGAKTQ